MAKELTEVQKVKRELKERDLKIKEVQRQREFEKKICDKINAMTPNEREKFLNKLVDEFRLIEAKVKDQQSKKEKAENKEYCELDTAEKLLINVISGMICGVSTGLLVGFTMGQEIGVLSTICASLGGFWMLGPLASMGIRNKRLFNSIKKLRVMSADKKIVKLNDSKLKIAKQIEMIKELSGEEPILTKEQEEKLLKTCGAEASLEFVR